MLDAHNKYPSNNSICFLFPVWLERGLSKTYLHFSFFVFKDLDARIIRCSFVFALIYSFLKLLLCSFSTGSRNIKLLLQIGMMKTFLTINWDSGYMKPEFTFNNILRFAGR